MGGRITGPRFHVRKRYFLRNSVLLKYVDIYYYYYYYYYYYNICVENIWTCLYLNNYLNIYVNLLSVSKVIFVSNVA
jgi:hypothetical protein